MNEESQTADPGRTDPGPPPVLHHIRLRGAWSAVPDGSRVRHTRRFGWPTALDPHERVWLVCESAPGPATVLLNGSPIGDVPSGEAAFAADISPLLEARNELVVLLPEGVVLGAVGLDVRQLTSAVG